MATQAVGNGVDRTTVEISVQDKCGHTKHQDSHLRSPKAQGHQKTDVKSLLPMDKIMSLSGTL